MFTRKNTLPFFFILAFFAFFFLSPKPASAFSFGDVVDSVKNFFSPQEKKEFVIDSNIALAPGGDVNKNGNIDAGDTVKFTYDIKNTTDEKYAFGTIKTNIDRKQINYIHNIFGSTGINDDGKTLTIPNIRIGANRVAKISFDARINYFEKEDPIITTEAEFVTEDHKSLAKSTKKSIKATHISKEKIPGRLKIEMQDK